MHVSAIPTRALAAVGCLTLAACGSVTSAAPGSKTDLRSRLPQSVRDAGVLKIASDLNYPPVDFKAADGTATGLDPDLAAALGTYLGLRVQFVDLPFAEVLPAVQNGKADLAMSAVIDTRRRQLGTDETGNQVNPGVDFVDYFVTGTSILVKQGNPLGIGSLDDLCGRTVALQRGTVQDEMAELQTGACTRTGKPLRIHRLDTDDQALAELAAGTAVADLNDYPVAEYNTRTGRGKGTFQVTGGQFQTSPYGITVRKDRTALRDVLAKALDQLIRNGEYDKVLAKWNVQGGAVTSAVVNGGR
ncbi:polar amino acid transport system substrate-binding protein [Kitasatospora gansuensis]|uniref:Polar amino acid transport system substrate-binding protein n=1 Tax=Kitasatospora gansuensis TaxID=258050 RepID=A0A7W7SIZ9_9ACTN|nr:ABC transporter substrate-binding protein [Kitasatospora gansuensis]MBB4951364.1 polar amino acid transport system substrate-binding protein [Kitasatospora gansuensis]